MRFLSRTMWIFLLTIMATNCNAQTEHAIVAKIDIQRSGDFVTIKAFAGNKSGYTAQLSYLLLVVREAQAGVSSNKQQGRFQVSPHEDRLLTTTTANATTKDRLRAFLYIRNFETNELVAQDSLVLNAVSRQQTILPNETIKLTGIVTDNTRSKVGRDFYEKFFIKYNQLSEKFDFVIQVTEMPSPGNSGKILLESDDRELYSFISMPNDDYLDAQADAAIRAITEYNLRKELLEKELRNKT